MKRFIPFLLLALLFAGTSDLGHAHTVYTAESMITTSGNQATTIIEIDDLWGIWVEANDPSVNAMQRIRVLDAQGTIVYLDRNADPAQEWISYQSWAPGTYQVQVDMEIGHDTHFFVVD